MWLMENWSEVDSHNIEIVGSDIDTRALKAAAEGIYGARALMRLSPEVDRSVFRADRRRSGPDRSRACGIPCSSRAPI